VNRWWAVVGVFGIILAAAYMLWLFQRTMLGPINHEENRSLPDLFARERLLVYPLVFLVFAIGLYPRPLFAVLDQPVREILERLSPAAHGSVAESGTLHPARFLPAK
jgi:NADH-quinone oxidoreductase subunit M